MAEAMIRGLLRAGASASNLAVSDPSEERRAHLARTCGIASSVDNRAIVRDAQIVVLAIKPQQLPAVLDELRGALAGDAVVLSIVAGVRLARLTQTLAHDAIVRAMPNTPVTVGAGATVWTATAATSDAQRQRVRALLGATGLELEVAEEAGVERATGLSGPMPAFAFLVIEALIDAGVGLGIPVEQARALTLQSLHGSIELMRQTQQHPAVLRAQVVSPGGATASGLLALERAGVRAAFHDAVSAVYRRALELGDPNE
ncbi:pyrroline-5-carboxylate reductase [soil metagenome]